MSTSDSTIEIHSTTGEIHSSTAAFLGCNSLKLKFPRPVVDNTLRGPRDLTPQIYQRTGSVEGIQTRRCGLLRSRHRRGCRTCRRGRYRPSREVPFDHAITPRAG